MESVFYFDVSILNIVKHRKMWNRRWRCFFYPQIMFTLSLRPFTLDRKKSKENKITKKSRKWYTLQKDVN